MSDILSAEEFLNRAEQPVFSIGEKVHIGFGAKGGAGYIGQLQLIDTEANEAVVAVASEGRIVRGQARFLSKLQ